MNVQIIGSLLVFLGAGIMLVSLVRVRSVIKATELIAEGSRSFILKSLRIHRLLIVFFLCGYVVVACAFLIGLSSVSTVFSGVILLLGAVFVLLGINLQKRMSSELRITIDDLEGQIRKRTRELDKNNERLRRELEYRVRVETALRRSRKRFDLAVEGSSDGLWDWPDVGKQAMWWSPRVYELIEFTEAELDASFSNFEKLLHPDDRKKTLHGVQDHLHHRVPYDIEYRLRTKSGKYHWFRARGQAVWDKKGKPIRMAGAIQDIDDRKQVEQSLRESEQRFRLMADNAPVMIWTSGPDKLRDYFNKAWLDFAGRGMGEELGHGWTEGVYSDDLEQCMDVYNNAFEARQNFKMEYRLRRHDGEYRWIVDHGVPRYTPNGDFNGYIGSCMDVTENKRA